MQYTLHGFATHALHATMSSRRRSGKRRSLPSAAAAEQAALATVADDELVSRLRALRPDETYGSLHPRVFSFKNVITLFQKKKF